MHKVRKPSISYMQRTLMIRYNRAADLLERMESEGLVSRMDASGKRTVLGTYTGPASAPQDSSPGDAPF